jgi:NOL1/NOP2/sun family putative RNA methylase
MISKRYSPKPLFLERMKTLLGEADFKKYWEILQESPVNSIRVNTLKISPEKLKKRLEQKGWQISQPFKDFPEIMIIKNQLKPGEIGRSLEHMLGYYYVQEIASMLPVIALNPKPNEKILDLAAAPGSKTTQIAAKINNTGTIIANDVSLSRIKILASNLERCGVTNVIITRKEGGILCKKLKDNLEEVDGQGTSVPYLFDKILVDAPCSGEGTLRSTPKTFRMWNIKTVKRLSRIQKRLFANAVNILKLGGEIVYSTCTHAPEENEEIVDFVLKNFPEMKIEEPVLPQELKCRQGITKWNDKIYNDKVTKSCRIYPQDNDTEGFYIAKLRKIR